MRKIWMNFRGCDNVEPGMPCTVIPRMSIILRLITTKMVLIRHSWEKAEL